MDTTNSKPFDLKDQIEKLENAGMIITRQWYDIWSESMRYFFSDHDILGQKRHEDWDYIVMNYIWPTAMQEIAKLSKNYPKITAQPYSSDDTESAEVWQGACQWQWQGPLRMRLNQIAAIFCGKIFGYRVSKVYWEDKLKWNDQTKQWEGDIQYKLWQPAFFWADGEETIDDGNCGTVRWVDLEYAKARWPEFADDLEKISVATKDTQQAATGDIKFRTWMSATEMRQSDAEDGERNSMRPSKLLSLIGGGIESQRSDRIGTGARYVKISDVYLKDYTETRQQQIGDIPPQELITSGQGRLGLDGISVHDMTGLPFGPQNWPKKITAEYDEPNYPLGRNVLSAGTGQSRIILNDQKWQFSRWPFVVTPHYLLPFMWQGINAVSLYKTEQDMINISVSHMVNNLKQFGDPRIALEDGAMALNPKTQKAWSIRTGAGALIRLVKGGLNKYRIEPPMPLSASALQFFQIMSQEFKNRTGMQSVGMGEQLRGGTTATEAQTLAISANDRVYLQSVYEEEWVKGVASLIAEMMQANYDDGRFVRIVGSDKIEGIKQITSKLKEARYDITIVPGTTLPFDEEKRAMKYKMAYDLLAQPTANPMLPDMLRVLDIPNWQKILADLPAYQKYLQFIGLYQAVVAGKVSPEQAVGMVTQAAVQEFQQNSGGQVPQRQPQGNNNQPIQNN